MSPNTVDFLWQGFGQERNNKETNKSLGAYCNTIEKDIPPGVEIFNICSGKGISAREIVEEISKANNKKVKIDVNQELFRKDEMDEEYGSYNKATKILGWTPSTYLYNWIKRTIRF